MVKKKVLVYKITTPIIKRNNNNADQYLPQYFNFNTINYCARYVLNRDKKDRIKTYNKSKTMLLEDYDENFHENYSWGKFITVTHGYKATGIDIETLLETSSMTENQGLINHVNFFIDKNNGNFYVEDDRNRVINISRIRSYFSSLSNRKFYYKEFNNLNNDFVINPRSSLYDVTLLPPIPFIEQLKTIKKVRSIEFTPEYEQKEKETPYLFEELENEAHKNELGFFKSVIKLSDFNHKKLSKEMLNFIMYLQESEKYGNLKVAGSLDNNITRVFSPDSMTRDVIFECEEDVYGWTAPEKLFQLLIEIIPTDTQLGMKNLTISEIINVDLDEVLKKAFLKEIRKKEVDGNEKNI